MADEDNQGQEESVRVFVRIRPLNKREIAEKQTIGWNFNETSMLEDTPNGQKSYVYDHCFGPTDNNVMTYDIVGKPVVLKAMEGYNGTVFTYGQTGSGKTWTMRGCESDPGMMVLCIRDILEWVKSHSQTVYTLKVAYMEVYNEEINDLLGDVSKGNNKNMKIVSEDAVRGAVIGGLVEEVATSAEDFMNILKKGEASRSYAGTEMNAESSRSHVIYRVSIEAQDKEGAPDSEGGGDGAGSIRLSYLNLVDLAGSERQKSTKAEGKVLKEGANINKSLLALGAVINKLGEVSKKGKASGGKPVFIPYRDSKLTRILKQSLGGNTLTSVLCAVTPAPMHREETVSTLKFGQLCKSIKNSVSSNDKLLDDKALLKQYRNTITELRARIEELTATGGTLTEPRSFRSDSVLLTRSGSIATSNLETDPALIYSQGGDGLSEGDEGSQLDCSVREKDLKKALLECKEEVIRVNEKLADQQRKAAALQRLLDKHGELEEQKAQLEEYEQQHRQEIEDEQAKLDKEKEIIQAERAKVLRDRVNMNEQEARIGSLLNTLDDRDSKLRQHLSTMNDQKEQWQRAIADLKRREDLVDEWQRSHKQRERKLQELDLANEKKFADIGRKEAEIAAEEQRLKGAQRELAEREQRLQVGMSKLANTEQVMAALEAKLSAADAAVKKREMDSDFRERELLSKRKEMESWDVLLREKDRKLAVEQKQVDEKEAETRQTEERLRSKETDLEKRLSELRQNETALNEKMEVYQKLQSEAKQRDKESREGMKKCARWEATLISKEEELKVLSKKLEAQQEKLRELDGREVELHARIDQHKALEDEFYNVTVAQITARHRRELSRLEALVAEQLGLVASFQTELESCRADLTAKNGQISDYEDSLNQRDGLIAELQSQLHKLEETVNNAAINASMISGPSLPAEHSYDAVSVEYGIAEEKPTASRGGKVGVASTAAREALTKEQFMQQLLTTKDMLYEVLRNHNALPDKDDLSHVRRALTRKSDHPYTVNHPNPFPHRRRSSSDKHLMLTQINNYKAEAHEPSQQLESGLLSVSAPRGAGDIATVAGPVAVAPGSSGSKRRSSNSRVFFVENEAPSPSNDADPYSGNKNTDNFTNNSQKGGNNNATNHNINSDATHQPYPTAVNNDRIGNTNTLQSQSIGNGGFQYIGSLQQVFQSLSPNEMLSPPQPPGTFVQSTLSESTSSKSLQSLSTAAAPPLPSPTIAAAAYSPQQASEVEYFFQSPPPPAHALRGAPVNKQSTRSAYATQSLSSQQRSSGGSAKSKSAGSTLSKEKERGREKDSGATEFRLAGSTVSPEIAKLLKTSRTSTGIPVTSIDLGSTASIKRFQNYH